MGTGRDHGRAPFRDRTAARLGLFAVVLVVAFGAGLGVGAAVGGEDDRQPVGSGQTHDGPTHGGHDEGSER